MTAPRLLTLNAGSSSLKFGVYEAAPDLPLLLSGQVSGLPDQPRLKAKAAGRTVADQTWPVGLSMDAVLERTLAWLQSQPQGQDIAAVGHRIVHGGLEFREAAVLSPRVLEALAGLSPLAPLHQPFNLRGVAMASALLPKALQVGVFDTSFHAGQPEVARLYALPRELIAEGVIAYGFHGLSYDYIAGFLREQEGERAGGRTVVLHLGSGVSLCALKDGRSVATTMGFSALDGPPMSTRSGSLDPGVVLHLINAKGMSAEAVSDLLYHQSGLLGLSGVSGDMVTLLASSEPHARQALEVYVYRIAREIGSLAGALGGLDTLVFTAGVGENASAIRGRISAHCAWLGVRLNEQANLAGEAVISVAESPVKVMIIPTDEEVVIARELARLMRGDARSNGRGPPPDTARI